MAVSRIVSIRSLVRSGPSWCLVTRSFASARDPIQQLFLDRIAEYKKRSATAPDGLVDADDHTRRMLQEETERLRRNFNVPAGQEDTITSKFSEEQFHLDPIDVK